MMMMMKAFQFRIIMLSAQTSDELSQAPAWVDEVEVRSSVDEVKHTASVDSAADDSLRVDDLDASLGLSRLFAETKQKHGTMSLN